MKRYRLFLNGILVHESDSLTEEEWLMCFIPDRRFGTILTDYIFHKQIAYIKYLIYFCAKPKNNAYGTIIRRFIKTN